MRRVLPVYGLSIGDLKVQGGNVRVKNENGDIAWAYSIKQHGKIGIAACARSATVYMTEVLRRLGYNVGHEMHGDDGSVGYHLAVVRPDGCFHQVRDPLKQISSMVAHKSWGFCQQATEITGFGLYSCMRYWLKWNKMCEEFCVWRYRIEQLPEIWDEFLERLGHEKCEMPDIPTNTNSHKEKYIDYTWDDLFNEDRQLAQDIYNKAVEYGYSVPDMDKTEDRQVLENLVA